VSEVPARRARSGGGEATPAGPVGATPPNIRLRRLKADHERLVAALEGRKRIRLLKTSGSPPEKYQLEYLVKSLIQDESGAVRTRSTHQVEITLTRAYPRQAPQCRMLTPIFHPNIAPHAICVGDHWAAGETLGSLVVRIGEMLVFQSYNLKSPLDGAAARWVSKNMDKLPLEKIDFSELLESGDKVASSIKEESSDGSGEGSAVEARCANCGSSAPRHEMHLCGARHLSCRACMSPCASCKGFVCLSCRSEPCTVCKKLACLECTASCPVCRSTVCGRHRAACVVCKHAHCGDCIVTCLRCKNTVCVAHQTPLKDREGQLCHTCARELRAARAQRPS
jgi:ubiquitin-protein ligase